MVRLEATARYSDSVVVRALKGWKFKYRKLDNDPGLFKLISNK